MQNLIALAAMILVTGFLVLGASGLQKGYKSGAQSTNQMLLLSAISQDMQLLYANQGYQYGNGPVASATLIASGKIPANAVPAGTSNINTPWGSTLAVAGATTQFTVADPAAPTANCIAVMTDPQLINIAASVTVGGGTARLPPIQQATATGDCSASANVAMTFTMLGQ
jgi:hypothetical protein